MRALIVAAVASGCFSPAAPTGAPCSSTQACPGDLVCSPATQTCERTATPIDAPPGDDTPVVDAPVVDAPIDAPASPYAYYRQITITNNGAAPLPAGLTIRIAYGSVLQQLRDEGKVRSDFADLRIIRNGTVQRDRIVDSLARPNPALSFALAAPIPAGATNTEYAVYYGAPQLTNAPANGSLVFPVYDDFATGIANSWLRNDAPATTGGNLVLRAGRTDALTTTASTDNVPTTSAIEVMARVVDPSSAPTVQTEGTFYYWFGYQHTGDFNASDPWIVWIARDANMIRGEQRSPIGCEAECPSAPFTQNSAFRHYAIERDPTATRFYLNGALAFTAAVQNTADYSVMVRNYMATSNLEVDWIRARARVSPEPMVLVGAEQDL